ncbi:MAG: hypothetical protein Kow0068_16340 [Marinilabiliales bacterium]
MEKPTPEETLTKFNAVKEKIYNGNASIEDKKTFSYSILSALGKSIKPDERALLSEALSKVVFDIEFDEDNTKLLGEINKIKEAKSGLSSLSDEEFKTTQAEIRKQEAELIGIIAPKLGLQNNELRAKLLPLSLQESTINFSSETTAQIDAIMTKYFTHNQSVLTDIRFLGFPFHYFYTAVFLLILFLLLCWIYARRINKINIKYDFKE